MYKRKIKLAASLWVRKALKPQKEKLSPAALEAFTYAGARKIAELLQK